jgi:hypothetical protein
MTDEMPLTPEQWFQVVHDATVASGHGDEVVTAVETTPAGWKVTVNPPITPAPQPEPDAS